MKKAHQSPDAAQAQKPNAQTQELQVTPASLGQAERQLKQLQTIKPRSKAIRSKIDQQKSALNKIYATNKKRIAEFEKTNYSYLALIRSTNNFYKIFGHSALYYTFSIAPKLNLQANLQEDKDFTARSSEGVVSIRDLNKLAEALATIKIKRTKTKNQTGDFVLFKLPWQYAEEQLAQFIEHNHSKMQTFNHIVIVDNIIPVLFLETEELLKALYENVRGMSSPVERETFGYKTIDAAASLAHLYLDLANGHIDKLNCLNQMKKHLKIIKYQTKLITDLKIWTPKTCARIGEIIIKVQDIIERELKNI